MTDFFDWLTATDYGVGADRLADAYNLSQKELRDTAQALAPAFAMALGRTMTDVGKTTELTRRFAPFFGAMPEPTRRSASAKSAADLTETLFGSRALTDAIARQVSSVTGTAPDTVELLMRNLTLMTMQTTMQMAAANIARQQPKGLAEGDYPTAMAEMMRRGANAVEALGRPSDQPGPAPAMPGLPEPMATMMRSAFPWMQVFAGGAAPHAPPQTAAQPTTPSDPQTSGPANPAAFPSMPFLAMLEGFAKGLSDPSPSEGGNAPGSGGEKLGTASKPAPMHAAAKPEAKPAEKPLSSEEAQAARSGLDEFVKAGTDLQTDYMKRMAALFEAHPPSRNPAGH